MIDIESATAFATEWIDAWNAGDMERVLAHYADDFAMTSPYIVERMGIITGTLKGKAAIRSYWAQGLSVRPPLRFELLDVFAGVNSLAIYYRSVTRGRLVIERVEFDPEGRVIRGEAMYKPE